MNIGRKQFMETVIGFVRIFKEILREQDFMRSEKEIKSRLITINHT